MDFKIAGTREGVTSIQMDIKIDGLSMDIITEALEQARQGRLYILDVMDQALAAPRSDLSRHAPRLVTMQVNPDKIGDRKSTRLNSSHVAISYDVFCFKKKNNEYS